MANRVHHHHRIGKSRQKEESPSGGFRLCPSANASTKQLRRASTTSTMDSEWDDDPAFAPIGHRIVFNIRDPIGSREDEASFQVHTPGSTATRLYHHLLQNSELRESLTMIARKFRLSSGRGIHVNHLYFESPLILYRDTSDAHFCQILRARIRPRCLYYTNN